MTTSANVRTAILILCAALLSNCVSVEDGIDTKGWQTVLARGTPTARHEAALIAYKNKLYLIGGRRINPVDVYDPVTNRWTAKSVPPLEIHHFQAVVYDDAIYIMGAMTGGWPNETPLDRVMLYYPEQDRFEYGPTIPPARRRGGAGVAVHDNKFYMIGGITNGHMDGYVPWLDEFDPATGQWRVLPDAPQARDHFQAVVSDGKLYAFAGRRTEHAKKLGFEQTISIGDVYDFAAGTWAPMHTRRAIPTERAGNMALSWNGQIIIGGGESGSQEEAHDEVQAFDPVTGQWRAWPSLNRGRHGSGFAAIGDHIYTASGSGNRGGEPELTSLERLRLSPTLNQSPRIAVTKQAQPAVMQWHKFQLSFAGPETSETSADNPFTDYRLTVTFTHGGKSRVVRGFYAADGNAAETGAESGNIWKVRFSPDELGEWQWQARLAKGKNLAINRDPSAGETIALTNSSGSFMVTPSDKAAPDFRNADRGLLVADTGYFRFAQSGEYWIKGGTNSPENLLGYTDFDDTYRMADNARDGESDAGGGIHTFAPHRKDWQPGDPSWRGGKGKALIGAINYLADQRMNAAYFLTLNILGDGKDVWPYRDPNDFTRFDASKFDQWEIVFDHMQAKGILLHLVTQETENELMLDGGDTGVERKLYLAELIARFGHHNALVWNLGEENGPVHWRPEGQNDDQRRQMIRYLKSADPYQHPVLLHTHSEAADKDAIAGPLLGEPGLDGLSFQVSERTMVNAEMQKWRSLAAAEGREWLITMDEIGKWDTGALPDSLDPTNHQSLRRHALWGHLLGGGAGVEWYFGAKYPANDLSSEDWRLRESLWKQTAVALDFFRDHLPYWDMQPCNGMVDRKDVYCLGKANQIYALYLPDGGTAIVDTGEEAASYAVSYHDPVSGNVFQGKSKTMIAGGELKLTAPTQLRGKDWVALVQF
ncbi:Kelch repeat-containing protein [Parasphingorhabdus cellanae]|uniref:DUF5060 domain-containing protein n=1 Tax=Parasphingorhabdus cellanae TaxID=2806553 RepID=A0ABX7T2I7_9SPHN|nr:DUF5060 domain-containing protein [Parasphingorhabdus cellanae]QTD55764.1 DUF5060 domain-containing protein [Parasphingorhabdus cellanae]